MPRTGGSGEAGNLGIVAVQDDDEIAMESVLS